MAELLRTSNGYYEDVAYWEYYNEHKDSLEKYKNTVITFDVSSNKYFMKYEPRDVEALIDDLKSLRLSREMAIVNISRYGYVEEQDYILEALGFSKKFKVKVTKDIEKQAQYFSFLFQTDKDCFVRFRNNSTGETRAYNIKHLVDPYRLQAILKSKYFTNTNDLMYSLNCFNNMYISNEDSLFSLQNIAIDLDFDTTKYTKKEVLAKLDAQVGITIPLPNLVEHSNRIRLIYTVEDVAVTKKSLNLYKRIGQDIVDRVKELGIEGSITLQPSTTYARFLGTKNTKNNSKVQIKAYNLKKYKLRDMQSILLPKPEWAISIEKANKKDCAVTQEEVFNEFKKKNKTKAKVSYIHNLYTLNMGRLEDLKRIQTIRQDGYKEILTYLYRNYCYLAGYNEEETFKMLIEFNNGFDNPRPLNKLDGDTKHLSRKQYTHRNETILKLLDISLKEQERLNLVVTIEYREKKRRKLEKLKEAYREEQQRKGIKSRKETNEDKKAKIKDLRLKGLKLKAIAEQLEIGESTVKRYISELKKEGLI